MVTHNAARRELPKPPPVNVSEEAFRAITKYALESAARLVSPPKEDHEDEHFECDDIAKAIRDLIRNIAP